MLGYPILIHQVMLGYPILHSFLPPLVSEENLWDNWHRIFYRSDALPTSQPNSVKALKGTQTNEAATENHPLASCFLHLPPNS